MSHIEKRQQLDEWEVNVCDNCGHEEGNHRKRNAVKDADGKIMYYEEGCMVIDENPKTGNRWLDGGNPYPRCRCKKFK